MYFIADVASNHNGDIKTAFKLIQKAKEFGANAVKFQYFRADTLISKEGFEKVGKLGHQKEWDDVYNTYKQFELPIDWIPQLKNKCDEVGVDFMCSCYDIEAVGYINRFVNIHKIGSGDITYIDMLKKINSFGKPVILAIGASNEKEVIEATKYLKDCELHLMQCNTNYEFKESNLSYLDLGVIGTKINNILVDGLSDHNKDNKIIQIAKIKGAKYIERHFKLDESVSPDSPFSMLPYEFKGMIEDSNKSLDISKYNDLIGKTVKEVKDNEQEARIIQRRSEYIVNGKKVWLRPDIKGVKNANKTIR